MGGREGGVVDGRGWVHGWKGGGGGVGTWGRVGKPKAGSPTNSGAALSVGDRDVHVLPHMRILAHTHGTSHMRILIWDAHTRMGQHFVPYMHECFICMFYFFIGLWILLV